MTSGQTYRFGAFTLDRETGELRKDGARTRLQEKPLRVLLLLIENAGRLVTREELRHRLWPADTFVDFDRNVNTAVKKLREALCDSAEQPRYVETIPRRGYRFIAAVEKAGLLSTVPGGEATAQLAPPPPPVPSRVFHRALSRAALAAALGLGLAIASASYHTGPAPVAEAKCAPRVTLAVLTIQHEHDGAKKIVERVHSFTAGFSDELVTRLERVGDGGLAIISGRAVQKYDCSNQDIREIGRALGAQFILEGKVRRERKGLRVITRLVDARDQTLILTESVEVPTGEIAAAPAVIAAQVARAVSACLRPPQPALETARASL